MPRHITEQIPGTSPCVHSAHPILDQGQPTLHDMAGRPVGYVQLVRSVACTTVWARVILGHSSAVRLKGDIASSPWCAREIMRRQCMPFCYMAEQSDSGICFRTLKVVSLQLPLAKVDTRGWKQLLAAGSSRCKALVQRRVNPDSWHRRSRAVDRTSSASASAADSEDRQSG